MKLNILHISDTHAAHKVWEETNKDLLKYEEYDLIIHSGDISHIGRLDEVFNFLEWYHSLPVENKILILGNHEKGIEYRIDEIRDIIKDDFPSITFLHHESVCIKGFNIFGSPYTPYFHGWAFNVTRSDLEYYWEEIPNDTDILVTHGPPLGIADYVKHSRQHVGCQHLLNRVLEIKPMLHQFGHIHEEYGIRTLQDNGNTRFVNASSVLYDFVNQKYKTIHGIFTTTLQKETEEYV